MALTVAQVTFGAKVGFDPKQVKDLSDRYPDGAKALSLITHSTAKDPWEVFVETTTDKSFHRVRLIDLILIGN